MKIALVELFVGLGGTTKKAPWSGSVLIRTRIKEGNAQRVKDVLTAIADAKSNGATAIVFPGWTLFGTKVPTEVVAASKDCTIVLETFVRVDGTGKRASTWLLQDGRLSGGPIVQRFAQASDVLTGAELSEQALGLVREIQAGEREISLEKRRALVLICGEINLVGGGGSGSGSTWHRPELDALTPPLTAAELSGHSLVLNPSHTWMAPNATREKRGWLASRGTLVTTANTHDGYWGWKWDKKKKRDVPRWKNTKSTAARAYAGGQNLAVTTSPLAAGSHVSIAYVDVP